jgi:hypothetical protein
MPQAWENHICLRAGLLVYKSLKEKVGNDQKCSINITKRQLEQIKKLQEDDDNKLCIEAKAALEEDMKNEEKNNKINKVCKEIKAEIVEKNKKMKEKKTKYEEKVARTAQEH